MFVQGQDFTCDAANGIIRCTPKQTTASSAFKTLQIIIQRLLPQIPGASGVEVPVDGVIGPTTVLAVQMVAARLAQGKYPGLVPLASAQPEEAIPFVASHALEIAGNLDQIATEDPKALILAEPEMPPDPISSLKSVLTGKRIAAAGATLMGFIGLGILASSSSRRALGTADRSNMLPPSDGTDQFDEDAYEHEAHEDDNEGSAHVA